MSLSEVKPEEINKVLGLHPLKDAWRMYLRNKAAVVGLCLFTLIFLMTIFGTVIYPVDPFDVVAAPFSPPGQNSGQLFGTDHIGRDVMAGVVQGGVATMIVAATAAFITIVIGITIGSLAGYYRGGTEDFLMRVTEFFQVMPPLILAMVLVTIFPATLMTIALAIGVVMWPGTARLTRGEFLRISELEYVKAAKTIGASNTYIVWLIILPNAAPPLIVSATLVVGIAILFESGLSYLGLGEPNTMSWGLMIGNSREYVIDTWWSVLFPGAAIFLTILSVGLIGDGLNDALNPKFRER